MIYSNVDFNVVYIDPSIEAPGDGTTPAGALKALPASAADFTDKTCYLIRRTTEESAVIIQMAKIPTSQICCFSGCRIPPT